MLMALIAKNKLAFVDGSLPQPSVNAGIEYHAWICCNNMILSWILNSVSKEIAASIIYIDTCHGMWIDLKEHFSQKNGPRVFQLEKSISALSHDNYSVSSYFTQLKSLWDELSNYRPIPSCSCGGMKVVAEHYHQEYVYQLLMGLNESFAAIRGQILLMEPLPSVNKVFSMITQEEKQQEISVGRTSRFVLTVEYLDIQPISVIDFMAFLLGLSLPRTSRSLLLHILPTMCKTLILNLGSMILNLCKLFLS